MLAHRLAVVRRHHHECLAFARCLDGREEPSDLLVDEGDLVVVRLRVPPGEGSGRIVRSVDVVVVDPQEEGAAVRALEPLDRPLRGHVSPALGEPHGPRRGAHLVVVVIESLGESALRVEHEARHEGRRLVAAVREHFREGSLLASEPVEGVGAGAVMPGVETGEDRRVARERGGRRGHGTGEDDTARAQTIEVWRVDRVIAVAAEPVRPRRIEGDDEEVLPAQGARLRRQAVALSAPRRHDEPGDRNRGALRDELPQVSAHADQHEAHGENPQQALRRTRLSGGRLSRVLLAHPPPPARSP